MKTVKDTNEEYKIIVAKIRDDAMKFLASHMNYAVENYNGFGYGAFKEYKLGKSKYLQDKRITDLTDEEKLILITDWLFGIDISTTNYNITDFIQDKDFAKEIEKRINEGRISVSIHLEEVH